MQEVLYYRPCVKRPVHEYDRFLRQKNCNQRTNPEAQTSEKAAAVCTPELSICLCLYSPRSSLFATPHLSSSLAQPSERNAYLRSRMYSRMKEMHTAEAYVRERRTRWDNDTRGLLKEADRLLRKKRPAPPGYMARLESSGAASRWKPIQEDADE